MANIRNSISMIDRMTPTLRSILKSMDSMMKVMQRLDKQSNNGKQSKAYRQAEKDIKRASNAVIKLDNYTQRAGNSASRAASQYGTMGKAVSSVANGMKATGESSQFFLQSLASGVYLAQKLANTVNGIMESTDTSRSQVARLGLYNTSQYTNEQLYGQIMRTALNTRSGLTETADLANKILISGVYKGQGAPQAAIGTAEIINKALVAGGGTAEENQRAIRQLTQGLASGVLQGDELRSIREQTPYFMQVLAEGLSKIDERFEGIGIGDLKELGAQGELTADRIVKAMWAMQDEVDADFKQMPRTFGQAVTSMKNIWQYFLYLLSDAEGPLGRVNNLMWKLVDYLQTPKGFELMNSIATGLNIIVTGILGVMTLIGKFVTFLQENANVVKAIFFALATAAIISAVTTFIAWAASAWPILLIITLVGVLVYVFLEAGFSIGQIVGAVAGSILFVIAVIWDAIILLVDLILWVCIWVAEAVVGVGAGIILIILGIVQVILWAVYAVVTALWFIATVIRSVRLLGEAAVQSFVIGVVSLFYGLAQSVLGILNLIAKGIDAVFGSNLSETVSGWSRTLEGKFNAFVEEKDPTKTLEEIRDSWDTFGSGVKELFTSDEYNLYGELSGVWNGAYDLMEGVWGFGADLDKFLAGGIVDPGEWYTSGYNWGNGAMKSLGDFNLGLPTDSIFEMSGMPEVEINGGDLDSIGSIKSDVNVSDEDIQLLRDMAARDYLLQVQSVTPVANVTFGDVRETADVHKIVEVIEEMVDEQMATAMVS